MIEEEIKLFLTNSIKADLRNISKSTITTIDSSMNTHHHQYNHHQQQQQQEQAIRFVSLLYETSTSLNEKIEGIIKPCIQLICKFIHNLSSRENIAKEVVVNRLITNCKLSVYILYEIFMFPQKQPHDHPVQLTNLMNEEEEEDDEETRRICSTIASYFGLYDELVCFMIVYSYDEGFLEGLTLMNPLRFSQLKVEDSNRVMESLLKRIFNWICVTSVENEIQFKLSQLGYQVVFKHLIHAIQHLIFKSSMNMRFNTSMKITKYWFTLLWKHDSSLMKPLIIELLKRMFLVMKVKRTNPYQATFNIYMNELLQSFMKQTNSYCNHDEAIQTNDTPLEDLSKFILSSVKDIITSNEDIEAKNQAIVLYYNLLIDDIDNVEEDRYQIVKSFIELLFDKVLFTDKTSDCRITALEYIQKIIESKGYKRVSSRKNNEVIPMTRIFNHITHVLKFDPNQSVRHVAFDLWLSIYDILNQQEEATQNLLILTNMFQLKSRDKEKKIRIRVFEKISEMGISKLNQSLKEQVNNQAEYSEPIISNRSLKLTRVVRSKKMSDSILVCHVLREILIIGMLDEEKKVRDLTEQLFVDLILSEMNPLDVMKELEESYHEIIRNFDSKGDGKPSCWILFESVLKGNINNIYSKQL